MRNASASVARVYDRVARVYDRMEAPMDWMGGASGVGVCSPVHEAGCWR
jgi:hypothetical protein